MHSSEAFVNGAASKGRRDTSNEDLIMINTLLSGASSVSGASSHTGHNSDDQKGHEERQKEPANKPGGFHNDPDDPSNPNEVRERHLKTVKHTKKVKVGTV